MLLAFHVNPLTRLSPCHFDIIRPSVDMRTHRLNVQIITVDMRTASDPIVNVLSVCRLCKYKLILKVAPHHTQMVLV